MNFEQIVFEILEETTTQAFSKSSKQLDGVLGGVSTNSGIYSAAKVGTSAGVVAPPVNFQQFTTGNQSFANLNTQSGSLGSFEPTEFGEPDITPPKKAKKVQFSKHYVKYDGTGTLAIKGRPKK